MSGAVQAQHIMLATLSGALVVLFGAFYALFFALAKLRHSRQTMLAAYGSYAAFFVSTMVLSETLNLDGFWLWLVATLLVGYLLAPQGIWHLCVGTHESEAHPLNLEEGGINHE